MVILSEIQERGSLYYISFFQSDFVSNLIWYICFFSDSSWSKRFPDAC